MRQKLHNRLIDISYKYNLSHLSSCISTLPILCGIYQYKRKNDIVILSNGHAGLAQYVCLEHFEGHDAEVLYNKYGTHPHKNKNDGIFCSTGSLGMGLPIAVGAAIADNTRHVNCVISDGECCEGSIWETLYFLSKHPVDNLSIFVNINGFSAYDTIDINKLTTIINAFGIRQVCVMDTSDHLKSFDFMEEKYIEAHYCKIPNIDIANELKL